MPDENLDAAHMAASEVNATLTAETVVEVSNVVEETSEGEVKPEDVKHLAEMVEKLSDEVRPLTNSKVL